MNVSRNTSDLATCLPFNVAWTCTYVLLLPVFLFILFVGFQQCRKPRPRPSATPHSDVFTFNMAAIEVLGILSSCFTIVLVKTENADLSKVGEEIGNMATFGQITFHVLVCLERYLAVVHPITYLHLKKRGVAIRNVSIALVWLLSFVVPSIFRSGFIGSLIIFIDFVLYLASLIFFCASVLYVLIRPGPGERGGDRKHVDQSKRRAFNTIAAITVALMLKFVTMFVEWMMLLTNGSDSPKLCLLLASAVWFHLPGSLVMPVLFLHRRVKKRKHLKMTRPDLRAF